MDTEELGLDNKNPVGKISEEMETNLIGQTKGCCNPATPPQTNNCYGESKNISFSCCEFTEQDNIIVKLSCIGRLISLNVTIKDVCPNKMITVGVLLYDSNNKLKTMKVKEFATGRSTSCKCCDISAGEFCFVIKDDDLCQSRNFKVKVIAHYTEP